MVGLSITEKAELARAWAWAILNWELAPVPLDAEIAVLGREGQTCQLQQEAPPVSLLRAGLLQQHPQHPLPPCTRTLSTAQQPAMLLTRLARTWRGSRGPMGGSREPAELA